MIQNSIGKLYIGISKDPEALVRYHNAKVGARFTKYVPSFRIVFLEKYDSMAQARRREIQIKKWRREKKEMLIKRYQIRLPTRM